MGLVLAQVLYNSALATYKASLAYSGAVTSGFEPLNAVDWRDFSLFKAANSTTYLTAQVTADTLVDTICAWRAPGGSASIGVTAETSPDGVTWTNLTGVTCSVGQMKWADITPTTVPSGGYIRARIQGGASVSYWRQISIGSKLQFPRGQWAGISPPSLYQGVVVENVISANGSIIGRNLRRLEKKGAIELTHLDPAWVRTYWDAFAQSAAKYAFWYRWSPVGYPTEICFAVADSIEAPVNAAPPPLMSVTMPIRFLS